MPTIKMKKQYDIVILGALCGLDYTLALSLSQLGLRVCTLRPEGRNPLGLVVDSPEPEGSEVIVYYSSRSQLVRILRQSKCVVSLTLGLMTALGHWWYAARFLPGFPKVINWATGSDMSEVLGSKGVIPAWYRFHLKTSSLNIISWQRVALRNVIRHRVPNAIFSPLPHYLVQPVPAVSPSTETLKFFHPSRMDWKVNDPGDRHSSKGNDRFLRAFIRALKDGLNAECVILDRGTDKELAKEIIEASGKADHFIWKKSLTRDEYHTELQHCDVVVDQFDIGLIGGTGVEAMSAGKPTIIYVDETTNKLLYRCDMPPVLNAHGEEEIYQCLMRCRDREFLKQAGKDSAEWAYRNHGGDSCLDTFIFHYCRLTGQVLPMFQEETSK